MNKFHKLLPFIFVFIFFTSCKKSEVVQEIKQTPSNTVDTVKTNPPTSKPPIVKGRVIALGTGSGRLVIDGSTLGLACDDVIKIKSGTYSNIEIKNINTGCKITIQNDGLVEIAGNGDHIYITKVSNLILTGSGTTGLTHGFVSRDNPQHRSISVNGIVKDLTIENFSFKNIGDYVIFFNSKELIYNGNDNTAYTNLKFLNNKCTLTGSFLKLEGGVDNGIMRGMVKNLEIAYLDFRNSNSGDAVLAENVDNYNVHHNTVSDVNSNNNNHNGVFTLKGSGSFHHNLVRNHQGNALRAWVRSLGTVAKEVLIYNNTIVNSRKYSAFEIQAFSGHMLNGRTTYVNAKVYKNLCGKMNTSKDWDGVILDLYGMEGGKCEVYDNTGFEFPAPNPKSYIVSQQSSTAAILTNNKYYATAKEAGVADINSLTIQN